MKGVCHGRICISVIWTVFLAFLVVYGDDFLEQGMCLIKLSSPHCFARFDCRAFTIFPFVFPFELKSTRET